MPGPVNRLLLAVVALLATGCSADVASSPPTPAPPASSSAAPARTPTPVRTSATHPRLRQELLAMLAADQKDRQGTAQGGVGRDQARTERLQQIVQTYGWPTRTLVGDDGASAAWAIAQHSDLDPVFQQQMLELMRTAAAAGEADPGELAYLTDRVAANAGQPQTYGTQMGCTEDGQPQPAPLAEPERVNELRAEAGLPTLEEYLAEMAEVCADI
ncbi:MAG: DUF6624 domain-containing protein [Propionibacteriaceae bacterium]